MKPEDFLARISTQHHAGLRRIVVYNVVETLLTLGMLWSISQLASLWLSTKHTSLFWWLASIIFVAGKLLASAWRQHQSQSLHNDISLTLRTNALHHALNQGLPGIGESQFSQQLTEHTDAVARYQTGFAVHRQVLVISCLLIVITVFTVDWLAGLILAVTAPLIPLFMILIGNQAQRAADRQLQTLTLMGNYFSDRVKNLFTLGIFQRQPAEAAAIRHTTDAFSRSTLSVLKVAFLSSAVIEFLAAISIALLALYIGIHLLKLMGFGPGPQLTYQSGFFLLLLAPEFYLPLRQLSQHYHQRATALAAADHLLPLFVENTRQPCPLTAPPALAAQALNLDFGDGRLLWQPLSFRLAPGQCLVLRGDSGTGKSTLLKMIGGELAPSSGTLSVNGLPPSEQQFSPGNLAYSGQQPAFEQGSLRDNLNRYHQRPDDDLIRYLTLCDLGHLSLDHRLSESGRGISGGEARRLSVARALASGAPLILLDEPTAELDALTEQQLCDALGTIKGHSTLVIATHSDTLTTLADQVIWLQPAGGGQP